MSAHGGRLDQLRQSLEDDPYRAGVLAQLALLTAHDREGLRSTLRALAHLNRPLAEMLARVTAAPDTIGECEGCHVAGTVTGEERAALAAATAFARHAFGDPLPALLIEFARQDGIPSFAHVADESFSYVCVGTRDRDTMAAALVHEFAHAKFPTHTRYMDEGIASFYEARYQGRDLAPRAAELRAGASPMLRVRALLRYDAANDPFFAKLDADVSVHVHDHAALFAGRVIDRIGVDGLQALARDLRSRASTASAAQIIETAIGVPLEALDPALSVETTWRPDADDADAVGADLVDAIKRATLRLDPHQLGALRQRLEAAAPLDSAVSAAALEAWSRILVFELLGRMMQGSIDEQDIAIAASVLERLEGAGASKPLMATLNALLDIGRLPLEDDQLAGLARLAQVRQGFDRALRAEPDNVDAQFQKARFTLLTPDEYAGDKSAALAIMRDLAERPDYGADVAQGMKVAGLVSP